MCSPCGLMEKRADKTKTKKIGTQVQGNRNLINNNNDWRLLARYAESAPKFVVLTITGIHIHCMYFKSAEKAKTTKWIAKLMTYCHIQEQLYGKQGSNVDNFSNKRLKHGKTTRYG